MSDSVVTIRNNDGWDTDGDIQLQYHATDFLVSIRPLGKKKYHSSRSVSWKGRRCWQDLIVWEGVEGETEEQGGAWRKRS